MILRALSRSTEVLDSIWFGHTSADRWINGRCSHRLKCRDQCVRSPIHIKTGSNCRVKRRQLRNILLKVVQLVFLLLIERVSMPMLKALYLWSENQYSLEFNSMIIVTVFLPLYPGRRKALMLYAIADSIEFKNSTVYDPRTSRVSVLQINL